MGFKEGYFSENIVKKTAKKAALPAVAALTVLSLVGCGPDEINSNFPSCIEDPQRKSKDILIGNNGNEQDTYAEVDGVIFEVKDYTRVDIRLKDKETDASRVKLVNDTWFEFDGKTDGRHYIVKKGQISKGNVWLQVSGVCKDLGENK